MAVSRRESANKIETKTLLPPIGLTLAPVGLINNFLWTSISLCIWLTKVCEVLFKVMCSDLHQLIHCKSPGVLYFYYFA